jgi:carbon-monoxide dehydrogenase medium subunit
VIPSAFEYHRASSLSNALALLAEHGEKAKVLAGGHSLLPMLKLRLASPPHLIDVGGVAELRAIARTRDGLVIGALASHADVAASSEVRASHRGLAEAAAAIGDMQVRNRGTIGGSLAHADPAADYPAAVLAFNAEIVARGPKGTRAIKAADFFQGLFTSALRANELITEVRFPETDGAGSAYEKFEQPASGFAVVGVCAQVRLDSSKTVRAVRLAATGVSDRPVRLTAMENLLGGKPWSDQALEAAARQADADLKKVREDLYAKEDYRRHLLRVVARRAAARAVA